MKALFQVADHPLLVSSHGRRGNVGVQEEETNPAPEWAEVEEAEP